jgi:asparagine synthase (glutamine-hydrolysing)
MADTLTHRGPDDSGTWCDADVGYAVGHRRLSIVDLSPSGHQPMKSSSGRWIIAFNGEIYNHRELRAQLGSEKSAPAWQGHSDTETLLACIDAWGVETTLGCAVGMFAIALWDRYERCLILIRDRMGEKPLYYGWQSDTFLFGSELKALRAHSSFRGDINRDALTLLLRHNCIPAPHSIFTGIFKLLPGHFLRIPFPSTRPSDRLAPTPYWQLNSVVANGQRNPFEGSEAEAIDALEHQLRASIGDQMLADVPLGAFLSGGIDSSTVVALMQAQSTQPVRTFTIGFAESGYDEAADAKKVAQHLGTDHTELYVQPKDALDIVPSLPSIYCEPFGDSSQIPTFLVSKLARQHVTVALSGDAGDELFGGYNRYLAAQRTWARMQKLPLVARHWIAASLRTVPPARWNTLFGALSPLLPRKMQLATPGEKAHKLAKVTALESDQAYFRALTSHWDRPGDIVIGGEEPMTRLTNPDAWPQTDSFEHWMMAMDSQNYLPDDILVKVDRAAMANSLETRVPLLDHRVVELAWRMPLGLKIHNGEGKWLLRQVLARHVPLQHFERAKMGFAIPIDSWLRGPLRDWAESLLDERRLQSDGFFNSQPIREMWNEHQSGRRNWQYHLWTILMFQAWLGATSKGTEVRQ